MMPTLPQSPLNVGASSGCHSGTRAGSIPTAARACSTSKRTCPPPYSPQKQPLNKLSLYIFRCCKTLMQWWSSRMRSLSVNGFVKSVSGDQPQWQGSRSPWARLFAFTNSEGYYSFPGTIVVSGTQAVGISYSGLELLDALNKHARAHHGQDFHFELHILCGGGRPTGQIFPYNRPALRSK